MRMHLQNRLSMCTATLVLLLSSGSSRLFAQDPQPLPVTKGAYRLPYLDGTTVRFSNNHLSHPSSLNKIDMAGQPSGGAYTVVSAAAGWAGPARINR